MKNSPETQKFLKVWLLGFIVLLLLMTAVGGITRLTRSGLSIVEWRPVSGILPPLNEEQWSEQFTLYQKSPEYQQVNSNFTLSDYKNIFIWEYVHRLLGRLIFLYALLPGLLLWRRKEISGSALVLICALVAGQGLVGWLMVKSGLQLEPQVSPFMLALHFFSALTVLLAVYYQVSKGRTPLLVEASSPLPRMVRLIGVVLVWQIFFGCLTSGLKAGFSFNTFPLMAGQFFPPGGWLQEPAWINFVLNPATVQWTHRWLGISVFVLVLGLVKMVMSSPQKQELKGPAMHLMGVILTQVLLGILNIIFVVPLVLAVAHQVMAWLLVMAYLNLVLRMQVQTPEARLAK